MLHPVTSSCTFAASVTLPSTMVKRSCRSCGTLLASRARPRTVYPRSRASRTTCYDVEDREALTNFGVVCTLTRLAAFRRGLFCRSMRNTVPILQTLLLRQTISKTMCTTSLNDFGGEFPSRERRSWRCHANEYWIRAFLSRKQLFLTC